jgi:hypothetical protein
VIGTLLKDAMQNIGGYVGYFPEAGQENGSFYGDGALHNTMDSSPYGSVQMHGRLMDSSRQTRIDMDTHGASLTVWRGITF